MKRLPSILRVGAGVLLALAAFACSTDSPTAPEQQPAPPPGGSPPSANWTITLTASPSATSVGADQPVTITIRVRRADNGQLPANGTTIVVSTSLGELGAAGSTVQSAVATLSNGQAQVLFFPGDIIGTAVIQAQLESSIGQLSVPVEEVEPLFITSVAPASANANGGNRVTISGTGFSDPIVVRFGSLLASVVRVDPDGSFVRVDTPRVPSDQRDPTKANSFFATEDCDSNGDGSADGKRAISTPVDVTVALQDGNTASLAGSFLYNPIDRGCKPGAPPPASPRAAFSFTVNGLTVLFSTESTPNPDSLEHTWVFGDGSAESSDKNPTHTYAAPGTYTVTLRVVNSSGSSTTSRTVTVS